MGVHIDHTVTSGTFSLDGETFDVDHNVWVVGDDNECIVLDAPHDVEAILAVVGDRTVRAIVCTHAHDDHIRFAPELSERTGAPILLHPDDTPVWKLTHPDCLPDGELSDGQVITVGGTDVRVIHTPGHAPGAVCLYIGELSVLFSGDTLFSGGPGATGRSFSDFPTIIESIDRLATELPADTLVHTGHGDSTTLGDEITHRQEWLDRGH
ncbi:MAG TPA: MBL fold metallo-hydrolase [Actinomycetes bacterium]|nr:MBL fold metallo-hydrolase [Actinomycetes bacterium]